MSGAEVFQVVLLSGVVCLVPRIGRKMEVPPAEILSSGV